MEFTIAGKQTTYVKINATNEEIINSLKAKFNLMDRNDHFVVLKENGLYRGEDTSHHGSPDYEYNLITKDEKLIRVYKAITELEVALREIQ